MRAVRVPHALLVGDREIGVAAVVAGAAVDQARLQRAEQHRHVDALDGSETLDVRVDQVGEAVQVDGTTRGAERGPGREGLGRGGDREIGLAPAAAGDLAERLLVDRREVRERALARDALAADEVIGRDLDPRDLHPTLPNASVPTSTIVWPPSTGITAPLTYDASGESSQATVPAISSGELGLPQRHVGASPSAYAPSRTCRAAQQPSISPSAIGVRTQPGQTAFARTPAGPWSRAMHCVSIVRAAFDEQ